MSIQDPPQTHWLLRRSHNFVAILCKILTQTKSHRHYFKYFSGNFQTVDHNWQLWLTFYDNSLRVKPQNQRCLHFFYLKKFLHTKYIYIIFSSNRIILYIRTANVKISKNKLKQPECMLWLLYTPQNIVTFIFWAC